MDTVEQYQPVRISVEAVQALCDPFKLICWRGMTGCITIHEIAAAISEKRLNQPKGDILESRIDHIERVAWFVVNGWQDAISIDVGVPHVGCYVDWPVVDGNHRLAAAIYKNDKTILADMGGSVPYMEELGLTEMKSVD